MIRTIKTACTVNLLLAIALFAGYILYGISAGLPVNENFFGMGRSHLGRGGGPMVPPWILYAVFQAVILVLFLRGRYFESRRNLDRTFCLIFVLVFLSGFLMQHLPHRVIFSEDEKVVVIPWREQALTWYLWCSNAFYAFIGSNND
jgi:hypothetical protein